MQGVLLSRPLSPNQNNNNSQRTVTGGGGGDEDEVPPTSTMTTSTTTAPLRSTVHIFDSLAPIGASAILRRMRGGGANTATTLLPNTPSPTMLSSALASPIKDQESSSSSSFPRKQEMTPAALLLGEVVETPKQLLDGFVDRVDAQLSAPRKNATPTAAATQTHRVGGTTTASASAKATNINGSISRPATSMSVPLSRGGVTNGSSSAASLARVSTAMAHHRRTSSLVSSPQGGGGAHDLGEGNTKFSFHGVGVSPITARYRHKHQRSSSLDNTSSSSRQDGYCAPLGVATDTILPTTTPPRHINNINGAPTTTATTTTTTSPLNHVAARRGGHFLKSLGEATTFSSTSNRHHHHHPLSAVVVGGEAKAGTSASVGGAAVSQRLSSRRVPISIINARKWRAERGWDGDLGWLREERANTANAKRIFDAAVEPIARRTVHTPSGGACLYDPTFAAVIAESPSLATATSPASTSFSGDKNGPLFEQHGYSSVADGRPSTSTTTTLAVESSLRSNHPNRSSSITSIPRSASSRRPSAVSTNLSSVATGNNSGDGFSSTAGFGRGDVVSHRAASAGLSLLPSPSTMGPQTYTNECSELAFDHVEWTPHLDRCALVAEEVQKRKKNVEARKSQDAQRIQLQHLANKESSAFWKRNPNPSEEIKKFKALVESTATPPLDSSAASQRPSLTNTSNKHSTSRNSSGVPSPSFVPTKGGSVVPELLGSSTFFLTSSSSSKNQAGQNRQEISASSAGASEHNANDAVLEHGTRGAFLTEIVRNPSGLSAADAAKLDNYMRWSPMVGAQKRKNLTRLSRPPIKK